MEINNKPRMIRGAGAYIPKAFKFYDLKSGYIAPVVFVLLLSIYFIKPLVYLTGNLDNLDLNKVSLKTLELLITELINSYFVDFIVGILVSVITAVYLFTFICEQKGEVPTPKYCIGWTVKNALKIALIYIVLSAAAPIALLVNILPGMSIYIVSVLFFLIIPAIIIYITFLFYAAFILDKGKGFIGALASSKGFTNGHKIEIFSVILIFKFLTFAFQIFIQTLIVSSQNNLLQIFIIAFANTIFVIAEIRLIGLMYMDLEYGRHEELK